MSDNKHLGESFDKFLEDQGIKSTIDDAAKELIHALKEKSDNQAQILSRITREPHNLNNGALEALDKVGELSEANATLKAENERLRAALKSYYKSLDPDMGWCPMGPTIQEVTEQAQQALKGE